MGVFRVQNNEDGAPPLCKLSTPQISLHACKGIINTYERICADDLRGMIRQENHFLVLISDHEFTEVLARIVTMLFANFQEALVHIVRVRDAYIFYVLDPDEVVEIQRIHADELEIQLGHVEHVVDVVKSQDELISRAISRRTTCHLAPKPRKAGILVFP